MLLEGKCGWEQEPMGRLAGRGQEVIWSRMFWCQWHLLMGLRGGQPRPKATVCEEGRRVIERGMNEVCREDQRWVWPCKVRGAVREQVEGQGLHRRGGRRQPATSTDKP